MIFKLQRPIDGSNGPVLAYDQHRNHQKFLPMTRQLVALFNDQVKIYVEAKMDGEKLVIDKRVPDRGW